MSCILLSIIFLWHNLFWFPSFIQFQCLFILLTKDHLTLHCFVADCANRTDSAYSTELSQVDRFLLDLRGVNKSTYLHINHISVVYLSLLCLIWLLSGCSKMNSNFLDNPRLAAYHKEDNDSLEIKWILGKTKNLCLLWKDSKCPKWFWLQDYAPLYQTPML